MSDFAIIRTVINNGLRVKLFMDGDIRVDYCTGDEDTPEWEYLCICHIYLSGKKTSDRRRFKKLIKKLDMRW